MNNKKTLFSFTGNIVMSFIKRLSRLIWGEEEEPLLNETQIELIRNSWEKVEAGDMQETGLALFRR